MTADKIAEQIFHAALKAVDPYHIVREHAGRILDDCRADDIMRVIVAGFGKASYQMALAVESIFPEGLITDGIVITKYGHAGIQQSAISGQQSGDLKKIKVYEAAHPVPDENGCIATEKIIGLLQNADKDTLVLSLISGGGSALFVAPYHGVSLSEKQMVTDQLLRAGADISELNSVRKHLSRVKGGRLAEIIHPARAVSLIISDVIGDKLDVIASGPTSPDSSTFYDALHVMDSYSLSKKAPENVINLLRRGGEGSVPETPKRNSPLFEQVDNIIIGSSQMALEAAKKKAQALGFETEIISSEITGEARDVGKLLAEKAKRTKEQKNKGTMCFISGGETTVRVIGRGKGGRNTELALGFATEIEGVEGITLLSAGTDGTDGPTDAAGAIVNGETVRKAKNSRLEPRGFLDNNDSYNFFKNIDSLLITGPTGTNVMDLQIVLIEEA